MPCDKPTKASRPAGKLHGAWLKPTNVEAMLALRLARANREYDGSWRGIEKQAA